MPLKDFQESKNNTGQYLLWYVRLNCYLSSVLVFSLHKYFTLLFFQETDVKLKTCVAFGFGK